MTKMRILQIKNSVVIEKKENPITIYDDWIICG